MHYDTGQTVTIFEDPITRQKPEGDAILRELYKTLGTASIWRVEFTDEPGQFYERTIQLEPGDTIKCEATED